MNEVEKWRWHQKISGRTNKQTKKKNKERKIEKWYKVRDSLMERRKENERKYRHIDDDVHISMSRRQAHAHTFTHNAPKRWWRDFVVRHIIFNGCFRFNLFFFLFFRTVPIDIWIMATKLSSNSSGIDVSTALFYPFHFGDFPLFLSSAQNHTLDSIINRSVYQINFEWFLTIKLMVFQQFFWIFFAVMLLLWVRVPVAKIKIINEIIESIILQLDGSRKKTLHNIDKCSFIVSKCECFYHNKSSNLGVKVFSIYVISQIQIKEKRTISIHAYCIWWKSFWPRLPMLKDLFVYHCIGPIGQQIWCIRNFFFEDDLYFE